MQHHIHRTNNSEFDRLARLHKGKSAEFIADEFNRQWNFLPLNTQTESARKAGATAAAAAIKRIR